MGKGKNLKVKGLLLLVFLFGLKLAEAQQVRLLFASFTGERSFMSDGIKTFAKDLEEKSSGKVRVEFSWGGALGKIPEYYDITVQGICDVGLFNPVQCAKDIFLLSSISSLPFLFPNSKVHTDALLKLKQLGLIDKQLDDDKIKLLFIAGSVPSALLTYKKPVVKLEDVKGMKLHAVPGMEVEYVKAMGAVPVDMAGAEVYMALQTGVIDGHIKGFVPLPNFKWCEVTRYVTLPKFGSVFFAVAMNRKSYERLPKDVQNVIDEMIKDPKYSYICAKQMDQLDEIGERCLREHGVKFLEWEPAALDELSRRLKPVWEKWIAERESKGLKAKDALKVVYNTLKEAGVKKPALGWSPEGF